MVTIVTRIGKGSALTYQELDDNFTNINAVLEPENPEFVTIELGHASDTTLSRVSAGVVAIEGSNILVSGGALGTPASGTLTNCTGLPQAGTVGLTISDSPRFAGINLGSATDTTITRPAAGRLQVEGVEIAKGIPTNKNLLVGDGTTWQSTDVGSIVYDQTLTLNGSFTGGTVRFRVIRSDGGYWCNLAIITDPTHASNDIVASTSLIPSTYRPANAQRSSVLNSGSLSTISSLDVLTTGAIQVAHNNVSDGAAKNHTGIITGMPSLTYFVAS